MEEKTIKNKRITRITINAMMLAIILLMSFIPQLGYIEIPGFTSLTLIGLVVLIGAYLLPFYGGIFLGTVFGLTSLIVSLTTGAGNVMNIPFQNPLISLLPRVIFGLLASIAFYFVRTKFYYNKKLLPLMIGLASFLLSAIHSLMVLLLLVAFKQMGWPLFLTTISLNSVVEALLALIIVPMVAMSLYQLVPKYNDIPPIKDEKSRNNDEIPFEKE